MCLLLLGGSGQVGAEFQALCRSDDIVVVAPDESALDLTHCGALESVIAEGPWDIDVNSAAYTDVDRAESDEATAFAINGEAPSRIAAETSRLGISLIHISTDYAFDGSKGSPYIEADAPGPLNTDGRSKLAGEQAVAAGNPRHVILRTSWVYSPCGTNFVRAMLRLASERPRPAIVADRRGCPTAARDVAQVCLTMALRCSSCPEQGPYGLYHFAGAGEATWFDSAKTIIDLANLLRPVEVVPIRTMDYSTPAPRTVDTRLDCAAVDRDFGVTPRPWRAALEETLSHLAVSEAAP